MDKKNKDKNDDLLFLNSLDDQYYEILDNIEMDENTDSKTTDLTHFRVINTNNAYPNISTVDSKNNKPNTKK